MQLVDREELLARLGACLDDAYVGGRLVLVGGEAGVGKPSLVRAFVEVRPDAGRLSVVARRSFAKGWPGA